MRLASASSDISLKAQFVLKFAEMGGCLTFPVMTITLSMETVVHQTVQSKSDTNALMELPQPHLYAYSLENISN